METGEQSGVAADDFRNPPSSPSEPERYGAIEDDLDSPQLSRCSTYSYNPADFPRAYEIEEFMPSSFRWPDSASSSFVPRYPGIDNIDRWSTRETRVDHPRGRGNIMPLFRTPKIRFGLRSRSKPADPLLNLAAVGDSFTYEQLLQATSGFGVANLIRRGHSGDLYHGSLESGTRVVVKRFDLGGGGKAAVRKEAMYRGELAFFSRTAHPRLVPLLGHCLAKEKEKLLVYKYMTNGDLASSLSRKAVVEGLTLLKSMDWITRLNIAIGVAEALSYLHHECTPPIVHGDIQASSILLDDKFEVRLGSLSEACAQEGKRGQNAVSRILRESAEPSTSNSSTATCTYDVYCLGKVLLELVTGRLSNGGSSDTADTEMSDDILPYISIYDKELLVNILDPSLIVDEDFMEEVWAMAIVAKSCVNPKSSRRPIVEHVLKALENPLSVVREDLIKS